MHDVLFTCVYFFLFVINEIFVGVAHGDELLYLFSLDVDGLRQPSLLDNLVSGRMVSLWTDFAKFG